MADCDERNSFMSDESHFYALDVFIQDDDNSENDLFKQSFDTTDNLEEKIEKGKKRRAEGKRKTIKKTSKIFIYNSNSKKSQAKSESDYKKNICGYITKKVLRELTETTHKKKVLELCMKENVSYDIVKNYYELKIERVTGPSHIPGLFEFTSKEEYSRCQVMLEFFKWFLKEKYIRHLLTEGKMEKKMVYVDYKNKYLLPYLNQLENGLLEELSSSSFCLDNSSFCDVI